MVAPVAFFYKRVWHWKC